MSIEPNVEKGVASPRRSALGRLGGRLMPLVRAVSRPTHWSRLSRDLVGWTGRLRDDLVHARAAMQWLCRAQDAARGGGVSAGYYFADGWLPPYAETTGYIIETFLCYGRYSGDSEFLQRAERMGQWELEIQLPSGGVRGGIGLNELPVVFNTGQVIFGWINLYRETGKAVYLEAAKAAANYLLIFQDAEGTWTEDTLNHMPHAYHSRVAWALLEVYRATGIDAYRRSARANLLWVLKQARPNGWFDNAGFSHGQRPYTHTIAYTIRGLLESAAFFEDDLRDRLTVAAGRAAEAIMMRFERGKSDPLGMPKLLPATLDEHWKTTDDYTCLTGNCQMAINWMKLYEQLGDIRYLNAAMKLLDQVKMTQSLNSPNPGIRGAIGGSFPLWGGYERLGYPNWAAKFFVDALLLQEGLLKELQETSA